MKQIILLHGKAGAGKDLAADMLVDRLGFKKFSFADSLKRNIADQFSLPIEMMYDRILKQSPVESLNNATPRKLMQDYGDFCRSYNENVFVNKCLNDAVDSGYDKIIIVDARYKNEITLVKSQFPHAIALGIKRKNHNSDLNENEQQHASELSINMENADIVIENNGKDINEYFQEVLIAYAQYLQKLSPNIS